ncbi:hypothetical protein D9619_009268 [Psilocybe cf. subviscida]|uniref:Polyketide synthase methyltransferase domain-containing protein n=1 Tax=Psilocybe cf. subviscida TaxID=2480587 RepID=A0A8H5BU68_9AGAR|nr:hypothetical protein D9619_009268 [Psilocybe cf. subviscida]
MGTRKVRCAKQDEGPRLGANSRYGCTQSVCAHYDLSNEVFASFLSWDMTYTCAIFDDELNGPTGDLLDARPIAPPRICYSRERLCPADDLERAQMAKMRFVCRRARIRSDSRVLEIGCGWGSFAIFVAATYGASVEALTLSAEQGRFAEQNVKHAGLSHLVTIHVCDYREMPKSFHRAFDAVVSLGVMEHVGSEYMGAWFKKVEWAMKPTEEVDFVKKHIFPGGQLSSIKTLVGHIVDAGLNVVSIDEIGPHYARTLREWRNRFERNFDSHIRPALVEKYPDMSEGDVRVFQRKWMYYFTYCEAGFATRSIQDHIVVCSREVSFSCTGTS